jgi:hypothetical protein
MALPRRELEPNITASKQESPEGQDEAPPPPPSSLIGNRPRGTDWARSAPGADPELTDHLKALRVAADDDESGGAELDEVVMCRGLRNPNHGGEFGEGRLAVPEVREDRNAACVVEGVTDPSDIGQLTGPLTLSFDSWESLGPRL